MKNINAESKQLLQQSQNAPIELRAYVLITTAKLDTLKAALTDPAQLAALEKVEKELEYTLTLAHQNEAMVSGLRGLLVRLVEQYQTANAAYNAGWDARLSDVVAQLTNADADALLKRVKAMDTSEKNLF